MQRIVLGYSGGLKSSAAIAMLAEECRAEIVSVTLDLGQGRALDDTRERALASGAVRAHVIDARHEFAQDFIVPALAAGAFHERRYALATALSRPLIAKQLVSIAEIEGARTVAHGCGTILDSARIEAAARALDSDIRVLAPVCDSGLTRAELMAYVQRRGTRPLGATGPLSSIDANLWARSTSAGAAVLAQPLPDLYVLTRSRSDVPETGASVDLEFERGGPVSINGVAMPLVDLMTSLETIAGAHGVGRFELTDRTRHAVEAQDLLEAPAAVVLHTAHAALQQAVTPSDERQHALDVGSEYADLISEGLWYTSRRNASDVLVKNIQEKVTGTVRLELVAGRCQVIGCRSAAARPTIFSRHSQPASPIVAAGRS